MQYIDITDLAFMAGRFSERLFALGFRLIQVIDARDRDLVQYIEPPMCAVPAGPFLMGSATPHNVSPADEKPQHTVTLAAFQIGKYPVRVAEYDGAVRSKGVDAPKEYAGQISNWEGLSSYPDLPVCGVNWFNAIKYAQWMR